MAEMPLSGWKPAQKPNNIHYSPLSTLLVYTGHSHSYRIAEEGATSHLIFFFLSSPKDIFPLIFYWQREGGGRGDGGRGRERERNIVMTQTAIGCFPSGIESASQACVLIKNQTGTLLVHGTILQLSHMARVKSS